MTGDVIKSFLVGLGFGVDDASLSKFNKAIASATLKVTALYASIKATAAGIVYGISQISAGFEQMGYEYHIIAPAINKALVLRRELLKAYAAAGINITKVIQSSIKLNMSLAKTKFAFEAIYKSVASKFFGYITQQSDLFRKRLYQNLPKIQNALEHFVKFVFKALQATSELGTRLWSILGRVYDFFVVLDKATGGWSTKILGALAAWKLLNLEFLATPLGIIIAGLVAILALFDDFKTYEEGGKSLFNWSSFIPVINAVTDAVQALWDVLQDVADTIGHFFLALTSIDRKDFFSEITASGQAFLKLLNDMWDLVGKLGSALFSAFNWAGNGIDKLLGLGQGTGNFAPNVENNPTLHSLRNPLGTAAANQTNQNVHQQTQINVTGSADANAVGRAVAGQQSRVNFDMVRNLKGATR